MKVLVTGAAGSIGRMIAQPLRDAGHTLTLTDLRADPGAGIGAVDVTDAVAVGGACDGTDAVVHLAGIPSEASFEEINSVNVVGTHNVLAAAAAAGGQRVILASSNHAVGFHRRSRLPPGIDEMSDPGQPRPDTYYGWGKAASEALGMLFHDRFGMDVIALRIGTCCEVPGDTRTLATWLAPVDVARLINACLIAPRPGFRAVWAISHNTRRWWSLAGAEALGYRSIDNAERFADDLIHEYGEPDRSDPVHDCVGGRFCLAPLGEAMR